MDLCQDRRGIFIDMKYIDTERVELHYKLPLNEIIVTTSSTRLKIQKAAVTLRLTMSLRDMSLPTSLSSTST